MLHPNFIEGARCLQSAGLSLDFWIYHTQLNEMENIARALPDLKIILKTPIALIKGNIKGV